MTCADHQGVHTEHNGHQWRVLAVGSRVQNMVDIGLSGMVEQVNRGARPRQGACRCHWGDPLMVTEKF